MITDAVGEAGITTTLAYRNVARGYLPLPVDTATDLQAAAREDQHPRHARRAAVVHLHRELQHRQADRPVPARLGCRLPGCHELPRLPLRRRLHEGLRHVLPGSCRSADNRRSDLGRGRLARPLTPRPTTRLSTERSDGPDLARGLRERLPRRRHRSADLAAQQRAAVPHGRWRDPETPSCSCRTASPAASTAPTSRTARHSSLRAVDGRPLRLRGERNRAIPVLATACTSNDELTVWTCTLRDGVTYHDGATFEAQDVIVSLAAQWDALSPLHKGATGAFSYWPGLWGGFLNPPAPCGIEGQPACEE